MKKLYLANAYGFSSQTKSLLFEFIKIFNNLGIEVFEPFEGSKHILKKDKWAFEIANVNYENLIIPEENSEEIISNFLQKLACS